MVNCYSKDKSDDFVCDYEKYGDIIKVYLKDGSYYTLENNKVNEMKILNIMKYQVVRNAKCYKDLKSDLLMSLGSIPLGFLNIYNYDVFLQENPDALYSTWILGWGLSAVIFSLCGSTLLSKYKYYFEAKKDSYYVENESYINGHINKIPGIDDYFEDLDVLLNSNGLLEVNASNLDCFTYRDLVDLKLIIDEELKSKSNFVRKR